MNFNPETPMHLSSSLPNPLARLTGLLAAFENARSGTAAREKDLGKNLNKALVHADENNQPRPEAVVLGRPPEGAVYVRLPPLGGGVELERSRFLPGTDRGFPVDDEFQAHPMSCESLAKP